MKKLLPHSLTALCALSLNIGCAPSPSSIDEAKADTIKPLEISDIIFRDIQSKHMVTDEMIPTHEFVVKFNRPISAEELEPLNNYRFHYQTKYKIDFKDGNTLESWGMSPIMYNLDKPKSEEVIARDFTGRNYNADKYKHWRADNIENVYVELYYSQNPNEVEYKLVDTYTATEF